MFRTGVVWTLLVQILVLGVTVRAQDEDPFGATEELKCAEVAPPVEVVSPDDREEPEYIEHNPKQQEDPWAWITRDGVPLKNDGKVVGTLKRGDMVEIIEERGDSAYVAKYLWSDVTKAGWASKTDLSKAGAACRYFAEAIEREPTDSMAHFALGSICFFSPMYRGQTINIVRHLDDAIQHDSDFWLAYNDRAAILRRFRAYKKMISDYNQVIRLRPDLAKPYEMRGDCWLKVANESQSMTDYKKAIADYTKAIELAPATTHPYFGRADVWLRLEEYAKAQADLNEAHRLRLADHVGSLDILVWIGRGEYDKAIENATALLAYSWEERNVYAYRAVAWAAKKEYAKALADFNEATKERAGFGGRFTHLAETSAAWFLATCPNAEFRDGTRALKLAEKVFNHIARSDVVVDSYDRYDIAAATANDPLAPVFLIPMLMRDGWKHWRSIDVLAAAYAETGQYGIAAQWQRKAIEVAPKRKKEMLSARLKLYEADKPYRMTQGEQYLYVGG